MGKHTSFILTPLSETLKNQAMSMATMTQGIGIYPVCECLMRSLFLQLAGAQEQKLKCICWDIATEDFPYRYERYHSWSLNECSAYRDKAAVFTDIIMQIKKVKNDYDPSTLSQDVKKHFIDDSIDALNVFFDKSGLQGWGKHQFDNCLDFLTALTPDSLFHFKDKKYWFFSETYNCVVNGKKTNENLKIVYEVMYNHRNRCAHNAISYQPNWPLLHTLSQEQNKYANYYIFYAILILIDNIIVYHYNYYIDLFKRSAIYYS